MKRLLLLLLVVAGIVSADDRYPFAGGPIVRLDPDAKQITIKTGPAVKNFTTTNTTYLLDGNTRLTFDKLKIGDPVKLNYYTNETGKAFIRRLKIEHPPVDDMVDKTK